MLHLRHFASLWLLLMSLSVTAADPQSPHALVQSVTQNTFARISDDKQKINRNKNHLHTIIREEMLPHIDYRFAAYKALGKNFKQVPKAQLEEYVALFKDYLVSNYAITLGFYDDQTIVFEPETATLNKRIATVRARLKDAGRPDINMAFKLKKDRKTAQWKAFDIVAEGISLVDSKRSEFGQIIRQEGFAKVLAAMRKTIAQSQQRNPNAPDSAQS